MSVAPHILRALIRNDEALVDHLAPQAAEKAFGGEEEFAAAREIAARITVVGLRLQDRRAQLHTLTAGCTAHPETLAGSLVTRSAAQPASISPTP
jgi:hypothetical protein